MLTELGQSEEAVLRSPIQSAMLSIYKQVLGVCPRAPSSCVLDEMSARSVQFYWFRACCNFWRKAVTSDNPLLKSVVRAEMGLSANMHDGRKAWLTKFNRVLESIGVQHIVVDGNGDVPVPEDIGVWVSAWEGKLAQLRETACTGDPRAPSCPHRQRAAYAQCFRTAPILLHTPLSGYLKAGNTLPHDVVVDNARFRLSSHTLGVIVGR